MRKRARGNRPSGKAGEGRPVHSLAIPRSAARAGGGGDAIPAGVRAVLQPPLATAERRYTRAVFGRFLVQQCGWRDWRGQNVIGTRSAPLLHVLERSWEGVGRLGRGWVGFGREGQWPIFYWISFGRNITPTAHVSVSGGGPYPRTAFVSATAWTARQPCNRLSTSAHVRH